MIRLLPRLTAPRAVFLLSTLGLSALAVACGPSAVSTATPTAAQPDAFAVVRATSQAAFQIGQDALARGDLMRGCPAIDTAKTTDPDNNPAIQRALDQCLTQIPQLLATSEATNAAATPSPTTRGLSAPTAAPAVAATPVASTPTRPAPPTPTRPAIAVGSPSAAAPTPTPVPLVAYRDPQGRFTIGAPPSWQQADPPQALFNLGSAVFEWHDPGSGADVGVSVDTSARAISPELYAAAIELGMQAQVPGYASESALPTTVAANPAVRRVFTFSQRDAAGADHQARAVQVVVLKGQTPYVVTALASTDAYAADSPIFDVVIGSFQFS